MSHHVDRREFLAGLTGAAILLPTRTPPAIRFSVIGVNHDHINGMPARLACGAGYTNAGHFRECVPPAGFPVC